MELILVDDHSSDTTWPLMESLAKQDQRVRAVRNYGQEGLTYSLNMGLDFARGEFVARIDVDDFAHSNKTEKQLSLMESNPRCVLSASCYRIVDDDDWFLYSHCPSHNPVLLRWSLCFRNHIRHSTVMWRRSLDLRYEPSFPYAQDYELWCRMSRMGDILVLPEVVTTVRLKRGSITNTKHEEQEAAADRVAAEQFEHYTHSRIGPAESRNLRMIYHLKSGEQFKVFDEIGEQEFERAVENYCLLARSFVTKEDVGMEALMGDIGNDIVSLMNNPYRREQTERALCRAAKEHGEESITAEMQRRFAAAQPTT